MPVRAVRAIRALTATALLAVAGCAGPQPPSGFATDGRSETPIAAVGTPSPARTPTTAPSAAASPSATAVATPAVRACRAHDLRAVAQERMGIVDTGAWSFATRIWLTNTTSVPCTLSGWVDFRLVGNGTVCTVETPMPPGCPADHHEALAQHETRVDLGPQQTWLLKTQQAAVFTVLWDDSFSSNCGSPLEDPYMAELRVPGDSTPVDLRQINMMPCPDSIGITAIGYDESK